MCAEPGLYHNSIGPYSVMSQIKLRLTRLGNQSHGVVAVVMDMEMSDLIRSEYCFSGREGLTMITEP